jgi:hypothetical protein
VYKYLALRRAELYHKRAEYDNAQHLFGI